MKTKKLVRNMVTAVILALMLVAMLPLSALAADDEGSITITGTVENKYFDLYRIFDVVISGTGENKVFNYTMNTNFVDFFDAKGIDTDLAAAAYVAAMENDSDAIKAFAEEVKAYVLEEDIAVTRRAASAATNTVITGLPLGYYLVYPEGGLTATCSLTTTQPDATVALKSDYPTVEKNILEDSKLLDGTDAAIGDVVTFRLKLIVPDMTGYETYKFVVTDTLSKGLTFNDDVSITLGGETYASAKYTLGEADGADDANVITITFLDFINNADDAGKEIIILYTADLNEHAVIGVEGNPNTVYLTYSSDPKNPQTGTSKTPEDIVTVFTFELQAQKVDALDPEDKLQGAVFTLYTTTPITGVTPIPYPESGPGQVNLYLVADDLTSDVNGNFSHNVKAGTYYLFEKTPPPSYNPLDGPIVFTVTAVISEDGELTGLTIDKDTLTPDYESGVISTIIENKSGIILPGTGGIGTTIFIAGGALLMVAAVAFYIVYRKKNAN